MISKLQVFAEADAWKGTPFGDPLFALIDFLIKKKSNNDLTFTYYELCQAMKLPSDGGMAFAIISILMTNSKMSLLDMRYFLDMGGDYDVLYLPPDFQPGFDLGDISQPIDEFYHPETGELISNYRDYIFPYFIGTDDLRSLKGW